MNEIKQKVLTVMAAVFKMNVADIPDDAAPGLVERWDSLRHMNLVIALEEEFQIRFSDDEVVDLMDLTTIITTLKERLGQ